MNILNLSINSSRRRIPIHFGFRLGEPFIRFLQEHFSRHAIFLISDANVAFFYRREMESLLAGFPGFRGTLTFPAGELSKSRRTKNILEDKLLRRQAGRDTVILAMGGGVTGDLAGFVAATLHRGIPLIHLPTSLLAQVDSSIGGKVGINHPAGKNLIGAFYQPEAVFIATRFLKTLPQEEFLNGLGEVIKYAAVFDSNLWQKLEENRSAVLQRDPALLEDIIRTCVSHKIQVVERDEKEARYRSVLNFGHTVGHALEQLSNYRIKHGFAVAAGMRVAAVLSHQLLNLPREYVKRLNALLDAYGLNRVSARDFSPENLWDALLTDKKVRQQQPHFTLLSEPFTPELFYPIRYKEFEYALRSPDLR